jgi:hypothetical protein
MREAVEIAKLRLFLKLVAAVEADYRKPNLGLEPLPDIDFNIRSGNTLVGFATKAEIDKAFSGEFKFNKDELDAIYTSCETLASEFKHFQDVQLSEGADGYSVKKIKVVVQKHLNELREKLNGYMALVYGIDPKNKSAYANWLASHRPFHWLAEFYRIIALNGGFDVVIGNPPYVEYSKVKGTYTIKDYETESCGNLYAFVMERGISLLQKNGKIGMIVPLSITCGGRMESLRNLMIKNITDLMSANFEIFPSKLFDGAFQRLTIINGQRKTSGTENRFITKLHRWYSTERTNLIDRISYTNSPIKEILPLSGKYQSRYHLNVISRISENNNTINNICKNNDSKCFIYYQEATNYWMKATSRIPYYNKNGKDMMPDHGRLIHLDNKTFTLSLLSIMNSSLFYLWYITYSDGFHLSDMLVKMFPFDISLLNDESLIDLGKQLENDIKEKSIRTTRNTKTDKITIEAFKMNLSKPIIDEIDRVLAKHYGFTEEELDFIINYDIKYRMGGELEVGKVGEDE